MQHAVTELAHLTALCLAAAEPPRSLDGAALTALTKDAVTYAVRETYLKKGGALAGEYQIALTLQVGLDGRELAENRWRFEDTDVLPIRGRIIDYTYTASRDGGARHVVKNHEHRRFCAWFQGRWDTAQDVFMCAQSIGMQPGYGGVHLSTVWVPALVVRFPARVTLEKGFAWGKRPQPPPRALEQLSALQQWTLTGWEAKGDGLRLTLSARSDAPPDEAGERCTLTRSVVYDTGLGRVVRSETTFERQGGPEPERVALVMERVE